MRGGLLAIVVGAVTGCGTDGPTSLQIEPASVDLTVELGKPAPSVALRVLVDGAAVDLADVSLAVDGAPVGTLSAGVFTSDGHTGGTARITASYQGLQTSIPVENHIHSVRLAGAVPVEAQGWFAAAAVTPYDAQLEPGDGAVIPPNLGTLDVDFGADDTETLHELIASAPDLDLHVYSLGVAGPRHISLTSDEWTAIAATTRGQGADLTIHSMVPQQGAPARGDSAHIAVADLDANALMFSAHANATALPAMYRYDTRAGAVQPFATGESGACLGCHVTVSPDGSRIAAATFENSIPIAKIVDAQTKTIIGSATADSPWSSAVFDPGGSLVTGYLGALTMRDGQTGAALGALATETPASEPTISPTGNALAYVSLETVPSDYLAGDALRIQSWNATTRTLGPSRELVRGGAFTEPEFSPDGAWLLYTRSASATANSPAGAAITPVDHGEVIEITSDARDALARFASPIAPARFDGQAADDFVWIVMSSYRPVGALPHDTNRQLWMMGFSPKTRTVTRPFHLPGQPAELDVLHAAMRTPI